MATKPHNSEEIFGIEISKERLDQFRAAGFHAVLWSLIGIVILPVVWMYMVSFNQIAFDTFIANPGEWAAGADLSGYREMVNNTDFPIWFRNSVIVTVSTTIVSILIGSFSAYSIGRLRFKGRKTIAVGLLLIQMFPLILIAIPMFLIFRDLGLANTLTGLVIAYVAGVLPFAVWMLRGFYENLPESLEEAAMVDGSTRFGAVVRVILPISTPAIATTAIFAWIRAWNDLLLALILINDPAKRTLPPGLTQWVGQYGANWELLMAGAATVTLPMFFVLLFFQSYIIRGLAEGAVKS